MDMFLNPGLLAGGLALAAIPVVLHLIMRQKPRLIEFPALRFIRQAHEHNRRTLRIRQWLLLALRMAAICLLGAALARPTVRAKALLGDREAPVAAALVFDTLPHMQYRHENQTRLEVAQGTADWLLGQFPDESQVGVFDSLPGSGVFQVDVSAARQRIERLHTRSVGQSLWRVLDSAVELLKSSQLRREIYVFTDLVRSDWSPESTARLQERLAELEGVGLYIIDVGVEHPQDFSLSPLRLSSQVLAKTSPLTIGTELTCLGPGSQKVVELYTLDEQGQPRRQGQETVSVAENGTAGIEFYIGRLDEGTQQGYLRLVGEDALPSDNIRYFTVDVRPAWNVLVVAPEPAEDQALYLTEALAPREFRNNGQARFVCTVVAYSALSALQLEKYAAVFVLDPPPLADAAWQQLSSYALAGGGVAVCLGPQSQPPRDFNRAAAQELLPATLGPQARFPDGSLFLSLDDRAHPLLAKFQPLKGSIPWPAYPVFRYWQLDELATSGAVVIPFSNGRPALLEKPLGQGRVLMLTTPLSEAPDVSVDQHWSQLATGFEPWPFVMLANEMALYLVGSAEERLNYLTGQGAVLSIGGNQFHPTYLVMPPQGEPQRLTADRQRGRLIVSSTEEPGNYRVRAGGEQDRFDRGFSVNLPAEATELTRIDSEQLTKVFGDIPFKLARNREEIDRDMTTARVGQELFPLLIMLLAAVLAVEHILANRFYREA